MKPSGPYSAERTREDFLRPCPHGFFTYQLCLDCVAEANAIVVAQMKEGDSMEQVTPKESSDRKNTPICSGVLDYFPAALLAVAKLSKMGNDKHNPGEPLHWAREKSTDQADCIARHLLDRGVIDPDTGLSHTVALAWRALALLQIEEEERGAPRSRGAY